MSVSKFIPFLFLGLLVSCKEKPAPPEARPAPVTVAKPVQRDVIVYKSFPATLTGAAKIEIRARVAGTLEQVYFKDGDVVEKGAKLYLIEPDTYSLAVDAAQADLEQAQESRDLAEKRFKRIDDAFKKNVATGLDADIAEGEFLQAKAVVRQAEAKLADAKLQFSYTTITSPVKGRMSRNLINVGNLVGNGEATLLTTVIDDSRMSAYFEVPERAMIRYLGERSKEGGIDRFEEKPIRL